MHFVLQKNDEGIMFGNIQLIIVHDNSNVYFVTKKSQSFCLVDQGVHCLKAQDQGYLCINQDSLLDYYPLPEYSLCGLSVIVLSSLLSNFRIMSGLKEVLKDAVLLVLPSLSPDVTNQLVEKLMDQGVEGLDDLVYVKDDILEFQCRKLLCSWKNQGSVVMV